MKEDNLLNSFDIEYYLEREGYQYKQNWGSSGLQLNVKKCPFCGQSKWKVYINADSGLGNCFSGSCNTKFNKFGFVKADLQTNDNRLVYSKIRDVAKELGWIPKQKSKYEKPIIENIVLPDNIKLPTEDGSNLEYLIRRGIDNYYTEYFNLRYCEKGFWKYTTPEGEKKDSFDKRIIIPIMDLENKIVAFQGRDITGTSDRKYKFPSQVASTGKHLYNGYNCLGFENAIMNEGVFDVIATQKALDLGGISNKVCVFGTFGKHLSISKSVAVTDDQLGKLIVLKKNGLKTITIMWDGERKAYEDAVDVGGELTKYGFDVRIATLPQGKDPNEVHYSEVIKAYESAQVYNKLKMSLSNPYE